MSSIKEISGHTRLVTLIGKPTHHSLSPATHNLAFRRLGIDAVYLCFDVEPGDLPEVLAAFKAMDGWDGGNVTMPCKQAIIPYLDGLDDAAELMGAVNVLKKDGGRIYGYNTDGVGFMTNLRKSGVAVEGARMVLLGPGGAGSAILVQAALDGVAHLDVFARTGGPSHTAASQLAARVTQKTGCPISVHDLADVDDLRACIDDADILANATSVGMGEGCTDTLVPAEFMRPGLAVADAIYHPRETQLICDAKERGCVVVPGLGMMIEQAAAGERIWYDADMPIAEVEKLFGE